MNSIETLAFGAEVLMGSVNSKLMRTLSFQGFATYTVNTGPVRINAYHKISDNEWDTIPFDFFDITVAAATNQVESYLFAMPEDGEVRFMAQNRDIVFDATNIKGKITTMRWLDGREDV